MNKQNQASIKNSRVALVIEVIVPKGTEDQWLQVMSSIPGRGGVLTRTWLLKGRLASDVEATDVCNHISKEVLDALVMNNGIQQSLPAD